MTGHEQRAHDEALDRADESRCQNCGAALAHFGEEIACPECHRDVVAEWHDAGEVDESFSGSCPTCGQNDLDRVVLKCAEALSKPDAPKTFDLRCAFFVGWVEAEVSEATRLALDRALKGKP